MRFLDYIRLAFKNLSRAKARTILTIIAITVGSFSLILMASVIISIRQSIVDEFQNLGAFNLVSVTKDPNSVSNDSLIGSNGDPSQGKKIDDTTLVGMKKIDHVVDLTPVLSNIGVGTMTLEGNSKKDYASILAFDPNNDVFNLSLAYGRKLTATDMDKIIIGKDFLEKVGYTGAPADLLGKHVILNYRGGGYSAPDWGALPPKPDFNQGSKPQEQDKNASIDIPAEIVGITAGGALDNGQSYINLAWGRKLATRVSWQQKQTQCQKDQPCNPTPELELSKEDSIATEGYSSIVLKVDDPANIKAVATAVAAQGYGATTAQAMLDQINQIIMLISIVLAVIGGISLFVATIGIVNTMVMAIYERTREIGVMRACGATKSAIRRLFTVEAGWLGFWGGICGLLVSVGITQVAKIIISKQGGSLGSLPLDHIGQFPLWLIGAVIGFTTLLGMASGLFPAIRAAKMNPVEALRYE